MIDLNEPEKKVFNPREKELLQHRLTVLLHLLLLIYLTIHNAIIPVISNLLRDQSILLNVHYWFLLHILFHYSLLKKKSNIQFLAFILTVGSMARIFHGISTTEKFQTWEFSSLLLTEISSLVYFSLFYSNRKLDLGHKSAFSALLLGIALPIAFTGFEIQEKVSGPSPVNYANAKIESSNLGCTGSHLVLHYPLIIKEHPAKEIVLKECGFKSNHIITDRNVPLKNHLPTTINLRLYKLKLQNHRPSWKFVRLIQLSSKEELYISDYLRDGSLFVIKSPERRSLGNIVLIPKDSANLALGKGKLEMTYDSIWWHWP